MGGLPTLLQSLLHDAPVTNANIVESIKQEGKATKSPYRWSSMLQVLAVATVIKHPIQSVFPEVEHYARGVYDSLVLPLTETDNCNLKHPLIILWSRDGDFDSIAPIYSPNHIVPVVKLCDLSDSASFCNLPPSNNSEPSDSISGNKRMHPFFLKGYGQKQEIG